MTHEQEVQKGNFNGLRMCLQINLRKSETIKDLNSLQENFKWLSVFKGGSYKLFGHINSKHIFQYYLLKVSLASIVMIMNSLQLTKPGF